MLGSPWFSYNIYKIGCKDCWGLKSYISISELTLLISITSTINFLDIEKDVRDRDLKKEKVKENKKKNCFE